MVFCFVQKCFFGQHKKKNCRAKREIFFPEFNIRLYDKNSESESGSFACRHVAICIPSAFSASDRTFQTMLSTVAAF